MRNLWALLLVVALTGCVRAGVHRLDYGWRPALHPEQVTVYFAGQEPEFNSSSYKVVAEINITAGSAASWEKVARKCQSEAAKLGAEFVVIAGGDVDAGTVGTAFSSGAATTVYTYDQSYKSAVAFVIARR